MNLSEIKSSEWSLSMTESGALVEGIEDIKQCIMILLFTRRGTDPLRPDFGCGAVDRIDQPLNSGIPAMTRDIIDAIRLYEPRVDILKTKVTHTIDGGSVTFNINFKIKNSVETGQQNITYGLN